MHTLLKLLKAGANINAQNFQRDTALIIATHLETSERVRILVDNNADPNVANNKKLTAIMYAVTNKEKHEIIPLLIYVASADLTVVDSENNSVLLRSIEHDIDIGLIEMMLQRKVNINTKNKAGMTALYMAVSKGDMALVRLLIKFGANVNTKDQTGNTVLMKSIMLKHFDIGKFLLENKADPNLKNTGGMTAMMLAIINHATIAFLQLLLDSGAILNQVITITGLTELTLAITHGTIEQINFLIDKGVKLSMDTDNSRALKKAVEKNNLPVVELLLTKGATVEDDVLALGKQVNDLIYQALKDKYDAEQKKAVQVGGLFKRYKLVVKNLIKK